MPRADGPHVRRQVDEHWERRHLLPLLTVAFLVAPLLLFLPHTGFDGYRAYDDVVTAGSVLLVAIAALQARGLVRFVKGLVRREQSLRDASSTLAAATSREDVSAAALHSMLSLTRAAESRAWFVGHSWTSGVVTARSNDGADVPLRADELVAGAPGVGSEPLVVTAGSSLHRALGVLDHRVVVVVPVVTHGAARALGLIALDRAPRQATLDALQTLAETLSLALDRLDLSDVQIEQRSERRLRSMVLHATDIIALLDSDLTICYVTPAVEPILGVPAVELLGMGWLDIVAPADREVGRDLVLRAAGGRPAHAALRLATTDGRDCIVDTTVTEVDDETHAGFVLTCHDVTERRELEEQLLHQAFHDALTGLANRALFHDRVEHALSRFRRSGGSCAVLFIDLDDFKRVNDSLGHAAGDSLLCAIPERITPCLREGDTAARLGGDEFAVLLEDVDVAACTVVATRLIEALGRPHAIGPSVLTPSSSIGIAVAAGPDITTDDLLRNADLALYEAKVTGKARWALFAPEMHAAATERLGLTNELRHALDAGQIVVYYQPVIDLRNGAIVGFEALARWDHPTRGILLPGSFIPIAEETGLIHQLGHHVLDVALRDAARWQQRPGRENLRMAVNVSGRQLQDPAIVDTVRTLLERHGVEPSTVILEFTESVLLPGDSATLERIHALSALGVRLYIDDFGTGYSSLSYLQQLPVDGMKLAQEFVRGLPGTPSDTGLVRAILDLAQNLGLDTVVAEGVERAEQQSALVALGYGMAQGFHLGMPEPLATIEDLLDRTAPAAALPVSD